MKRLHNTYLSISHKIYKNVYKLTFINYPVQKFPHRLFSILCVFVTFVIVTNPYLNFI